MLDFVKMDPRAGRPATIRQMFDEIAPRYDLANRMLSFGFDVLWRKQAVCEALARHPAHILDVATGTGDLAIALRRRSQAAQIVGSDFSAEMLAVARSKSEQSGLSLDWVVADALKLPFPDASFEAVTTAFGFRNFADPQLALAEFFRVLAPGGRLVILEFPKPPGGPWGWAYQAYLRSVLPLIGGVVSGKPSAYRYLSRSVQGFLAPEELLAMMGKVGFIAHYRSLTGGIAALHIGDKTDA